jgi:hypothetical protein
MELFLQRMTSAGALSSDWGWTLAGCSVAGMDGGSHQMKAKQQRAERGDEEHVDEVGRELAEQGAGTHRVQSPLGERCGSWCAGLRSIRVSAPLGSQCARIRNYDICANNTTYLSWIQTHSLCRRVAVPGKLNVGACGSLVGVGKLRPCCGWPCLPPTAALRAGAAQPLHPRRPATPAASGCTSQHASAAASASAALTAAHHAPPTPPAAVSVLPTAHLSTSSTSRPLGVCCSASAARRICRPWPGDASKRAARNDLR